MLSLSLSLSLSLPPLTPWYPTYLCTPSFESLYIERLKRGCAHSLSLPPLTPWYPTYLCTPSFESLYIERLKRGCAQYLPPWRSRSTGSGFRWSAISRVLLQ